MRAVWDDEQSKWWFSVLDIAVVLNEEPDYTKSQNHWKYLKAKLKLTAADGQKHLTNTPDIEGVVELAKHFPNNRAMNFFS